MGISEFPQPLGAAASQVDPQDYAREGLKLLEYHMIVGECDTVEGEGKP